MRFNMVGANAYVNGIVRQKHCWQTDSSARSHKNCGVSEQSHLLAKFQANRIHHYHLAVRKRCNQLILEVRIEYRTPAAAELQKNSNLAW